MMSIYPNISYLQGHDKPDRDLRNNEQVIKVACIYFFDLNFKVTIMIM